MDDCSICLCKIETDHVIKKLSCGHIFHHRCFINLVYRRINMFIDCPLCRMTNTNVKSPFDVPKENLRLLCSPKVNKFRCLCRTKSGKVCKNKSLYLNYGMCYQHNKSILRIHHYPLMVEYMYLILCQRNSWIMKVYLFDIGKKLIIKYYDETMKISNILSLFYEYFAISKITHIGMDYDGFYDYYNLEKPDKKWVNYCSEKYTLI